MLSVAPVTVRLKVKVASPPAGTLTSSQRTQLSPLLPEPYTPVPDPLLLLHFTLFESPVVPSGR